MDVDTEMDTGFHKVFKKSFRENSVFEGCKRRRIWNVDLSIAVTGANGTLAFHLSCSLTVGDGFQGVAAGPSQPPSNQ